MCGFFGSISFSGERHNLDLISKAIYRLRHRGPDDSGIKKLDNVIFGHRRLSIIDLNTDAAKQPVLNSNSILAYNGMIYNFLKLKNTLSQITIFKGNSDTEVLSKCLENYGVNKTLSMIDGMFAFAWYCQKKKEVYLVRDPMGEKPLYWAKLNNFVYFSSEMKSFFEIKDFSKKPNIKYIDDYLYTQKINGSNTIYDQINEVEPGEYIKISTNNGTISRKKYFSIEKTFQKKKLTSDKVEELSKCIEKSVISRTISDVPIGCLLSGGIDSSLVLNFMIQDQRMNKLNCYMADVKNYNRSESKDAALVFNFFKDKYKYKQIELHTKLNNFSNYFNLLIKTTKAFDEPVHFGNSPDLLNIVSQASKDGIKVLLSGEGSDELFFGYDRMIRSLKFSRLNKSKKLLMEEIYFGAGKKNVELVKNLCGTKINGRESSAPWLWLDKNINKFSVDELLLIFSQKFRLQTLLQRQDRVGMLCGLELRSPFLNKKLIEFANALNFDDKFLESSNTTKLILKTMAKNKNLIPNQIIEKKKIGFNSDITDWLREERSKYLLMNLVRDKKGFFNNYLNGEYANKIVNSYIYENKDVDTLIWSMFSIEIWHRVCGEGDINFFDNYDIKF